MKIPFKKRTKRNIIKRNIIETEDKDGKKVNLRSILYRGKLLLLTEEPLRYLPRDSDLTGLRIQTFSELVEIAYSLHLNGEDFFKYFSWSDGFITSTKMQFSEADNDLPKGIFILGNSATPGKNEETLSERYRAGDKNVDFIPWAPSILDKPIESHYSTYIKGSIQTSRLYDNPIITSPCFAGHDGAVKLAEIMKSAKIDYLGIFFNKSLDDVNLYLWDKSDTKEEIEFAINPTKYYLKTWGIVNDSSFFGKAKDLDDFLYDLADKDPKKVLFYKQLYKLGKRGED